MNKKKILVFTEMAFQGSGYYYLMQPLLQRLGDEYDIKVVGLSYRGEEYDFTFSLTPAASVQEGVLCSANIIRLWNPDVFICALDIPLQITTYESLKPVLQKTKYITITPLENPPLTQTWAAYLMQMNSVFFISRLGYEAAIKAGLQNVAHLEFGIDSESMKNMPRPEVRREMRQSLGYAEDDFVILTVADNQERKNLWAGFEIISRLKKAGKKVKHVLVTREHSPVGYKLRDLAMTLDINKEVIILERGLPREDLLNLYYTSDVYLATSKAEGLNLCLIDAMVCGLPCVATDTGAMTELLEDERGYLIPAEYEFLDVWGNSKRSMIDIYKAFHTILNIMDAGKMESHIRAMNAWQYVEQRGYNKPTDQLRTMIEDLTNETNS